MEVKNGNTRLKFSTRADLTATLYDLKRVWPKTMAGSLLYVTAMPHKSAGKDMDSATSLHNRMLAAIAVQNAQESENAGTVLVQGTKKAMKSESVAGQLSLDLEQDPNLVGRSWCRDENQSYRNGWVPYFQDTRQDQFRSFPGRCRNVWGCFQTSYSDSSEDASGVCSTSSSKPSRKSLVPAEVAFLTTSSLLVS